MKDKKLLEQELERALQAQAAEDYETALKVLRNLADENYAPAIGNLGCMYQLGFGVERDGQKAVELLLKAVDLGFGPAAHNLGTIYGTGMPGVEQNQSMSEHYRKIAKDLGTQYT